MKDEGVPLYHRLHFRVWTSGRPLGEVWRTPEGWMFERHNGETASRTYGSKKEAVDAMKGNPGKRNRMYRSREQIVKD